MTTALINLANLIVRLIAKASTDPDVKSLADAIHALVARDNATGGK